MKTKIISLLLVLSLVLAMVPMIAAADTPEYVYVTVSFDGTYIGDKNGEALCYLAIPMEELRNMDFAEYGLEEYAYDADGDGVNEITALHADVYVHTVVCGLDWSEAAVSGSAGSIFFERGIFGFADCNLIYYHNGQYPNVGGWGTTADQVVLQAGDYLDISGFSSWGFYSDSGAGFRYFVDSSGNVVHEYQVAAGQPLTVSLARVPASLFGGTSAEMVPEVDQEVFYGNSLNHAAGSVTTDAAGQASITFADLGTYHVWSNGCYGVDMDTMSIVSAPAYTRVIVTEDPVQAETNKAAAKTVGDLIGEIGQVDIFSAGKIRAAREAYDALTDSQKKLVTNYETLTAAEAALDVLYVQAAGADPKKIFDETAAYQSGLGTPSVGSTGGEWMVMDMTRAGQKCPDGYYKNVEDYVKVNINDKEQLHRSKSTDNSRVILALTSGGYDVKNVAGHNLLMGLTDMTYVKKQGINGPIWALIAFDCHDYEIPANPDAADQVTREKLINYILEMQLEDGGWALSGKVADPDMTGMALQALAPYYNSNGQVKAAVDKALLCLSEMQQDNGGFGSVDGMCAESCAQVIVALAALGIDPETDPRFVKNGISVVDALCQFAVEGGGFAHVPNDQRNGMATEQGQLALAAYFRFQKGQTALYDMTDVKLSAGTESNKTPNTPVTGDSTPVALLVTLVVVSLAALVTLAACRKKHN